jgi:alkylation response protein AidB-like acyl-CoA dehydrogenase
MRVDPTDEQEFLREAVAGVLAREATPALVRAWTDADDLAAADAIPLRHGWSGIGLAEELDGQGGGVIELAIMAEALGRACVPWDRLLATSLAQRLLGTAGSTSATDLATQTANGAAAGVVVLDGRTVPCAWPDHVIDRDRITLAAQYVPGAATATDLIVPVRMGDRVSLLRIDARAAGVTVAAQPLVDRTRALGVTQLTDAEASEIATLSPGAWGQLEAMASVLVAADSLGGSRRMLELTTAYVSDRKQFGVPVGSFQAVKHAAAEMLVDIEASQSAVSYASWTVDDDAADAPIWSSVAKSHVCCAAARVADRALFLHGAIGYTWEHDLQFLFKRAKSNQFLFGGPDAHRDRIAELLVPAAAAAHA